jgi:hypothetical protein
MDLGDAAGWVGAVSGIASLGWQGWEKWQAARAATVAKIACQTDRFENDVVVTVRWSDEAFHTRHDVVARLLGPRDAQLAEAIVAYAPVSTGFYAGSDKFEHPGPPVGRRIIVQASKETSGSFGSLFVVGLDQPTEPFRLSITVRDRATGKPLASRVFPMVWSPD